MKYKINIQKFIENPNYAVEKEKYDENKNRPTWNQQYDSPFPEKFIATTALDVELTDEEFKKVKAEIIKVFE